MHPAHVLMLSFLIVLIASGVLLTVYEVVWQVRQRLREARRRRAWRPRPLTDRYARQPGRRTPL